MADFAPPSGPPPPRVPEGWKAVWNEQYKEWFYVNVHTKKSQWDKPTEPAYAAPGDGPPPGPPPSYDHDSSRAPGLEKSRLGSNNPYGGSSLSDEELARKLQAEESAGASNRGAADSYYQGGQSSPGGQYGRPPSYGQPQSSPYGQAPAVSPAPPEKRGLFSKLTGGSSSQRPPQQAGYGGYPPEGYGSGYPPNPQYGQSYGAGGYQGYYPQQQQQQQPVQKKHGLGAGGGALLGAGAGLLGGALLMDAIDDHENMAYQQGYDNGMGNDGGGGGGWGGDDGGGDFGGGDFGGGDDGGGF